MHSYTIKLLVVNVLSVITWLGNVQNLFGALAAFAGFISGLMIICINWDSFSKSKPARAILTLLRKK